MAADHGPSIKDDDRYEALRDQRMSKSKAAAIANSDSHRTGVKGGHRPPYDDSTVEHLHDRAAELDIEGRSSMTKGELIEALRSRR